MMWKSTAGPSTGRPLKRDQHSESEGRNILNVGWEWMSELIGADNLISDANIKVTCLISITLTYTYTMLT